MGRWFGAWTRADEELLGGLLREMLALRPPGWSVVRGENEIVLRAPDRALGKFSVMIDTRGGFRIHFFDRALNHWAEGRTFAAGPDAAAELVAWAQALAAGRAPSTG
jgi:hypothetical protein